MSGRTTTRSSTRGTLPTCGGDDRTWRKKKGTMIRSFYCFVFFVSVCPPVYPFDGRRLSSSTGLVDQANHEIKSKGELESRLHYNGNNKKDIMISESNSSSSIEKEDDNGAVNMRKIPDDKNGEENRMKRENPFQYRKTEVGRPEMISPAFLMTNMVPYNRIVLLCSRLLMEEMVAMRNRKEIVGGGRSNNEDIINQSMRYEDSDDNDDVILGILNKRDALCSSPESCCCLYFLREVNLRKSLWNSGGEDMQVVKKRNSYNPSSRDNDDRNHRNNGKSDQNEEENIDVIDVEPVVDQMVKIASLENNLMSARRRGTSLGTRETLSKVKVNPFGLLFLERSSSPASFLWTCMKHVSDSLHPTGVEEESGRRKDWKASTKTYISSRSNDQLLREKDSNEGISNGNRNNNNRLIDQGITADDLFPPARRTMTGYLNVNNRKDGSDSSLPQSSRVIEDYIPSSERGNNDDVIDAVVRASEDSPPSPAIVVMNQRQQRRPHSSTVGFPNYFPGMLGGFRSIIGGRGGYDLYDEGGYRERRQQPEQPSRFAKAKRTGIDPLYGVSLG